MGEYGGKQRNQLSKAISRSESKDVQLQRFVDNRPRTDSQLNLIRSIQKKPNNTGLPDNLKSGIENLSGYSMDNVKVHYNSDKPVQLNTFAYAHGTNIRVESGQEKHLPHEAWRVVQQKQGDVHSTMQLQEENGKDNEELKKEADVIGEKVFQKKNEIFKFNGINKTNSILQRKPLSTRKLLKFASQNGYFSLSEPSPKRSRSNLIRYLTGKKNYETEAPKYDYHFYLNIEKVNLLRKLNNEFDLKYQSRNHGDFIIIYHNYEKLHKFLEKIDSYLPEEIKDLKGAKSIHALIQKIDEKIKMKCCNYAKDKTKIFSNPGSNCYVHPQTDIIHDGTNYKTHWTVFYEDIPSIDYYESSKKNTIAHLLVPNGAENHGVHLSLVNDDSKLCSIFGNPAKKERTYPPSVHLAIKDKAELLLNLKNAKEEKNIITKFESIEMEYRNIKARLE